MIGPGVESRYHIILIIALYIRPILPVTHRFIDLNLVPHLDIVLSKGHKCEYWLTWNVFIQQLHLIGLLILLLVTLYLAGYSGIHIRICCIIVPPQTLSGNLYYTHTLYSYISSSKTNGAKTRPTEADWKLRPSRRFIFISHDALGWLHF